MTTIEDPIDQPLAGELFMTNGLPVLEQYTAIECLSPDFDTNWQAHGAIDSAVELLAKWCNERALPSTSVEIVRLPGRTPLLFVECAATANAKRTCMPLE